MLDGRSRCVQGADRRGRLMDRWLLPGPAAFIEAVVNAIREGENVVIGAPDGTTRGLAHVLGDRLARDWRLAGPLEPGEERPIDELYTQIGVDDALPFNRTVASLLAHLNRNQIVVVAGLRPHQSTAWLSFVDEYANASRNVDRFERAQFLLLTSGVAAAQLPVRIPALTVLIWDSHVGEADVISYVLQALRDERRRIDAHAKLIARIVTRLALWDFDLVDRLLELDWRLLFEPKTALREADDGREAWATLGDNWESGGVAEFDGERSLHALVLFRDGDPTEELSMRVWAAQAAELLPVLELRRRRLAERMKASRGLPSSLQLNGEPVRDLNDVEISGLHQLARVHQLPPDIVRTAEKYRRMRNKLAHLEPLSADEAVDLLLKTASQRKSGS